MTEQSVSSAKVRTFAGTRQSGELLTKRQIFKGHGSLFAADQAKGAEEDDERRQHARSCPEWATGSTDGQADRNLANHSGRTSSSCTRRSGAVDAVPRHAQLPLTSCWPTD